MLPQFLIVLREGLEAALILGIVAAYLAQIGRPDLKRSIYAGTGLAVAVSVLLASLVLALFGGLDGRLEKIFEGLASLTAAVVLTYMIFWMASHARSVKSDIERRLASSTSRSSVVLALAFFAVLREGFETVLFLAVPVVQDPAGTLLGAFLGLSVAIVLAYLTMGAFSRLRISTVFKYTSLALVVLAAGLVGYGVHELVEAYEETVPPFLAREAWDVNPQSSAHPLHENGAVGSVLKSVLGYDGNPEVLRVVAYLAYWAIVGQHLLRSRRWTAQPSGRSHRRGTRDPPSETEHLHTRGAH